MPRVSKRTKKAETQPQIKYYRTYIYLRLSEKDGGHGRRDSIYICLLYTSDAADEL